jgi:hypothetical protein
LIKQRRTDHLTALIAAMGICIGSVSCGTPAMTYDEGKAFFAKNEQALWRLNEKLEICGIDSISADGRKSAHEKCLTDRETADEIESQLIDLGIESVTIEFQSIRGHRSAYTIDYVLARAGFGGDGSTAGIEWSQWDLTVSSNPDRSPRYQILKQSRLSNWVFKTTSEFKSKKRQNGDS